MVCLFCYASSCKCYTRTSTPPSFHLFSVFLLITSSLSVLYVNGRPIAQDPTKEDRIIGAELIGSRPPRCEGRCLACGRCEAVQVPIAPQNYKITSFFHELLSRRDENSNYKPLNWKCKCGDVIINP